MAKLSISIEHGLAQAEALRRVKKLLGSVKSQFADKVTDLEESWKGNTGEFSFKAMGMAVSGKLVVGKKAIEIEGTLPFAASLFKGKIEKAVREQAARLFS